MIEIIKRKEIKGILVSIALIALSIFLILRPEEMVVTILRIIGIFVLIFGVFDFTNYFVTRDEEKLFDYGLLKGIMEITLGIVFIFKYESLMSLFPMVLGLIIIFINIFKLQLSLNLKTISDNYLPGVIIAALSIILGVVILMNPFETNRVVVIVAGAIMLISELSNIVYSMMVLKYVRKTSKVVRDLVEK